MIYSVKAKHVDYEQVVQVVVIAQNEDRAMAIAKKEFDLAKNWVFPWVEQELTIDVLDINKEKIVSTVMR